MLEHCKPQGVSVTKMDSKKVGSKFPSSSASSSPKGKTACISNTVDNLANIQLDSQDGEWEVTGRKSRNRTGGMKQSTASAAAVAGPKPWGQSEVPQKMGSGSNGGTSKFPAYGGKVQTVDSKKQMGRGNAKASSWENPNIGPRSVIPPPLQNGWKWAEGPGASVSARTKPAENNRTRNVATGGLQDQSVEDYGSDTGHDSTNASENNDLGEDTDDDWASDGDYDSDASQKSHDTRKKNKWFKKFFESLDALTVEQINEPSRQWHCPACQNGPGAIDWYKGMQPLITHAKTKGAIRVKLHRELAELLEEELHRRGTSVIPAGELFGKWKGLREAKIDHEIVWPPIVVIQNTLLEKDDNDKWLGMGNQELVECFKEYAAVKARHSYGPNGHRGMSVLIFEPTEMGYLEAERLDKHFTEEGRDRDAWDRRRVLFSAGGNRRLYGYLASKEDMEIFNQHSQGKSKLRYEMRSYQEKVVMPMKQMSEDNQELIRYKHDLIKQQQQAKSLQETVTIVGKKLRSKEEETKLMRERSKVQHDEIQQQMEAQAKFYEEQLEAMQKTLDALQETRAEKVKEFEKGQEQNRSRLELRQAKLSNMDSGSKEQKIRLEEVTRILKEQEKGIEAFENDRLKLIKTHEEKKLELKQKHLQEDIELEEGFGQEMAQLMEKYTTLATQSSNA